MRFIGRVFVIFFAFLIACMAAGFTIAFGFFGQEWALLQSDPVARASFWIATAVGTSFTGAKAFLPLLLVIILAEAFRFRSIIFYALAGVGIALIAWYGLGFVNPYEESIDAPGPVNHGLQQVIAAGVVFGLAYWALAGRKAGKWLEPYPPR
jgi:putative copper export protein